jgi:hypothetical protein
MWAHFRHLGLKIFSMVWVNLQSNEYWPLKLLSKYSKVHRNSTSQNGNPLENIWAHSLTLSYTPKSVNVILTLHFRLAPSTPFALVVNPRLRLWHTKPVQWSNDDSIYYFSFHKKWFWMKVLHACAQCWCQVGLIKKLPLICNINNSC